MKFLSILSPDGNVQRCTAEEPTFFGDLNLDQVVDAITASKQEYNLKPFFYTIPHDQETIHYRQQIMQDLEKAPAMTSIQSFAERMAVVRRYLSLIERLDFEYHRKGWFLEAARVYCDAVADLARNLSRTDLRSRGLRIFRKYLEDYLGSHEFDSLKREAQTLKAALSKVRYCVILKSGKFSVRRYEGEEDYTAEIEMVFEKFRQGAVKDYLVDLKETAGMNHIEAKILEFVTRLFPEPFAALDRFCSKHGEFVDEVIRTFDREVQFYVSYLEFIARIRRKGLPFCYPQVRASSPEVFVRDGFDLALAHASADSQRPVVVCNDFHLRAPERILVVSGPNQGGKTTFARMFGQLHYLAALGCPVPGREACLSLPDQIFTHFERQEDIHNLRSKLQDDLVRIHQSLTRATPHSLFILNEIFASTTLDDAVFLSRQIAHRIMALNALCVWVTFVDELSRLSEKTISMVSTVDPQNPAIRTFKIIRKPADGMAYALSLIQKHRMTYENIKERIQP
ncbi:MutS domain V [Desulfacinum hydrothermale DSM 13146]|uniref:MutS domain V n=1 Tax=Desulfacinum hydrothermale DSM 13146 TaxID=1121390 RepID=A0A1W1XKB9_9BACT|nr:hypothetical protein [Desulfacinum hydrothermale]SMC23981.1 MutS domain V [Desulfacinum hydrothermale DSM 13146]